MPIKKKDVIKKARAYFARLESDKSTKGFFKWEDILRNINDPAKFEMFQKAFDKNNEVIKQSKVLANLMKEFPELSKCCDGPFQRCLCFYLKTDGSKASKEYNKQICEKYCTGSGRAEMVKEALMKVYGTSAKALAEGTSSERQIVDYFCENRTTLEQGFLADVLNKCPELNVPSEAKKFHSTNKTFFESFSGVTAIGKLMGNPIFFFFDDITKFVDTDKSVIIQSVLHDILDRSERDAINGIANITFMREDFNNLKANVDKQDDLDLNRPLYEFKVVNKEDFNEMPYNDSFKKENRMFMERSDEEINALGVKNIKPNYEFIAKSDCERLMEIAVVHNNKSRPGFFSWLFNTKYNKTYQQEIREMNAIKRSLKNIGVSDYTLNLIGRLSIKQPAAIGSGIEEAKEFEEKQNEVPNVNANDLNKVKVEINELNNENKQELDASMNIDAQKVRDAELSEDEDSEFDEEEYEKVKEI